MPMREYHEIASLLDNPDRTRSQFLIEGVGSLARTSPNVIVRLNAVAEHSGPEQAGVYPRTIGSRGAG